MDTRIPDAVATGHGQIVPARGTARVASYLQRYSGMSGAQKIKHSLTTTTEDAKNLLQDLAAAIGEGKVSINTVDERVEMTPHGSIDVSMKVSSKVQTESIRIELAWSKPTPPLRVVTESGEFRIGDPLPQSESTEEAGEPDVSDEPNGGAETGDAESPEFTQLLSSLSRERLYEIAQALDLQGRSSMDKAELIVALDAEMTVDDLTRDDLATIAADRIDTPTSDDTRDELLEKVSRC